MFSVTNGEIRRQMTQARVQKTVAVDGCDIFIKNFECTTQNTVRKDSYNRLSYLIFKPPKMLVKKRFKSLRIVNLKHTILENLKSYITHTCYNVI